jgi:uncharacterized protein (DUF2237 family)
MPFAEDLSVFFNAAEFASVATWGAYTASVILDKPTEDILGAKAQSNEYAITMPAYQFPGINRGDQLVIGADTFKVRESPDFISDGSLKHLKLTKL